MAFTGIGKSIKDFIVSNLTTTNKTIPGAINELKATTNQLNSDMTNRSVALEFQTTTSLKMNIIIKNVASLGWFIIRINCFSGPCCDEITFSPLDLTSTLSDTGIKKQVVYGADKIGSISGIKEGDNVRIKITFTTSTPGTITFLRMKKYEATVDYPTS